MTRRIHSIVGASLIVAACSNGAAEPAPATSASPPTTPATTTTTLPSTTAPAPTTTSSTTTTTSTTSTTTTSTTTTVPIDAGRLARTVLMVGLPLTYVDESTTAHLTAGGRSVILFSRNISTADQLRTLSSDVACAANAPVLIAVDQELGPVNRLGGLITPLPSTAEARDMAPEEVRRVAVTLGTEMLDLGINLDLAPVLDVVRASSPALYDRHLGSDPDAVADLGTAFAEGLVEAGVGAVAKHFPGLGLATTDPHGGTTTIDASLEELQQVDWVPFRAAVEGGIPAVMVGHATFTAIDPARPASLSPDVYEILRSELGFEGVAVTDSIAMAAVAAFRTAPEIAVEALAAGADLVVSVDWSQTEPIVAAVVAAVESGRLPAERLVEAAARVEAMTRILGIECRAAAGS